MPQPPPPDDLRGVTLTPAEVRAVLAGPLAVTRPVKLPSFRPSGTPGYDWTFRGRAHARTELAHRRHPNGCWQDLRHADTLKLCPFGPPGGRVWLRERWAAREGLAPVGNLARALNYLYWFAEYRGNLRDEYHDFGNWRSAESMPRWASRGVLLVSAVHIIPHGITPDAWAWSATITLEPAAHSVQDPSA